MLGTHEGAMPGTAMPACAMPATCPLPALASAARLLCDACLLCAHSACSLSASSAPASSLAAHRSNARRAPSIKSLLWVEIRWAPSIKSLLWVEIRWAPSIKSLLWVEIRWAPSIKSLLWVEIRGDVRAMFAEYLTDLDANLERRRARFQTGGDGKLEFSWGEGFLDSEGHRASMQATQIWHRASMQATQIWHRASMQATQIWHRASMQATHTVRPRHGRLECDRVRPSRPSGRFSCVLRVPCGSMERHSSLRPTGPVLATARQPGLDTRCPEPLHGGRRGPTRSPPTMLQGTPPFSPLPFPTAVPHCLSPLPVPHCPLAPTMLQGTPPFLTPTPPPFLTPIPPPFPTAVPHRCSGMRSRIRSAARCLWCAQHATLWLR